MHQFSLQGLASFFFLRPDTDTWRVARRWLGHGALITNTVHGVVYLAIWGVRGE